jgi:hypothetical protein
MAAARAGLPVGIDEALGTDLARCALAVARRFAGGATMWCLAPTWPEHARHLAVEFVHPVIVGTRALPAVSVEGPDPVSDLRPLARSGDLLVGLGPAVDGGVAAAVRRATAWGLATVWIGSGPRPEPGAADHVLWVDDPDGQASHDGRVVLLYHVLWELTHVCFEHPGLLTADIEACTDDATCVTCSDEGRLGEVVAAGSEADAVVRTARGAETVDTTLVGQRHSGDLVLIHAGAAIAVLEDAEA